MKGETILNEVIVNELFKIYPWKAKSISQGDYIQGVLAPELAISLIADDYSLDVYESYEDCYQIWCESREYGEYM